MVLPSGLPDVVGDVEDLARFLTSSSQFNALMVKPSAFLPSPQDLETSVFRHGSEPREDLWRIAAEHVIADRALRGAAILKASHVRAAELDVVPSEPPPRHAAIVGWPASESDPDMAKAERKERAILIAR